MQSYMNAAVKNETSLALLNIGQSVIANIMMAAAMGFTVWGWAQGRFTVGDVVLVNTLLAQLFRRSEEHTSELQSLMRISYAVFCLKKTNTKKQPHNSPE